MYGRYLAEPARYPAEVAFYSRLFRAHDEHVVALPGVVLEGVPLGEGAELGDAESLPLKRRKSIACLLSACR